MNTAATPADEARVFIGTLKDLGKVTVEPVAVGSDEEKCWDSLMREHHPLGYKRLPGRRIKYLAWVGEHPVAALSFSGSAPKIEVRDRWIGWAVAEKKIHRHRLVNNSRFLILPGIRVKNLASHVLGQALRRLPSDWEERFGFPPWLVESFVDSAHHSGASYRAAGFLRLGQTKGFSRKGRVEYVHHGQVKDLYVTVLDPEFRVLGGFLPKPAPEPQKRRPKDPAPLLPKRPKSLARNGSSRPRRGPPTGSSFPLPTMSPPTFSKRGRNWEKTTLRPCPENSRSSARTSPLPSKTRTTGTTPSSMPWDSCPASAERASSRWPSISPESPKSGISSASSPITPGTGIS